MNRTAWSLPVLGLLLVGASSFLVARSGRLSWDRLEVEAASPAHSVASAPDLDLELPSLPAREPGATAPDPVAERAGLLDPARPIPGRWAEAEDALPIFLRDDEPLLTQLRQLQIYVGQQDPTMLWASHVAPVLAPDGQAEAQSETSEAPSQAELDAFRNQLGQFADELGEVLDRMPEDMTLDSNLRIASSSQSLETISYDELARIQAALHAYPGFWNLPSYLDQALAPHKNPTLEATSPGTGASPADLGQAVPDARATLPSVPAEDLQYDNCLTYAYASTCVGCPQVDGVALLSAAFALEVAAKGVELALDLCPKKIFIVSKTFYSPCAIILASIKTGLELAALGVSYALEQSDECEEDYHLGLVHLYLDETVSSRASEQSHDFHALRSLRVEIENSLLRDADDRVGIFQLPSAQGGYLDAQGTLSVRFVVADTIALMQGLGYDVRNAEVEYADAETLLGNGDYQGAFARYRLAYRAAVRVGRELSPVSFP